MQRCVFLVFLSLFVSLFLPTRATATPRTADIPTAEATMAGDAGGTADTTNDKLEMRRYLVDTGPLRIRDQFLLGIGFLAFDPVAADVLPGGRWQVDLISTVTNTYAHSEVVDETLEARTNRRQLSLDELRAIEPQEGGGIFHLDGEMVRTALTVRRGLETKRPMQFELVVPVLSFQGGVLDSTIEGFHDEFGFGQAGREGVPRNDFTAYARSQQGEVYLPRDPGTHLGDVIAGFKIALKERGERGPFDLALEAQAKLPTGDDEALSSTGSVDFGVQLLATQYFERACLHSSLGILFLGSWDELGLERQTLLSGMLAYERAFGSRSSALLQLTVAESPFESLGLDELAETSFQLTLGAKRVLGKGKVLFVGFTENIQNFNNTADVGFHIGLAKIFD